MRYINKGDLTIDKLHSSRSLLVRQVSGEGTSHSKEHLIGK